MRRFTIAATISAMLAGTALSGATGATAAPISAVPVAKAVPVAVGKDMVERVGHRHWRRHHRRHHHGDAALALGAAGLFLGLSALAARPHYHYHPYDYDRPVRYYYEPWSPAWFDYCMARYRSFNPDTGYFKGYDGKYHFCR